MNRFKENLVVSFEQAASERELDRLRKQGGLFVDAVRLTRMPMVIADARLPENPIVFANAAFEKLSGYTAKELAGQDPFFMAVDETETVGSIRGNTIERAQASSETLEINQYRRDGSIFRAAVFINPISDRAGILTHYFLSFRDITRQYVAERGLEALALDLETRVTQRTKELKVANQKLSELIAERDMLLVEVNHRAKNSLSIASSLLAIHSSEQSDEDIRALLEEAQARLTALGRVHDLLCHSKNLQRIDFGDYLRSLCDAFVFIERSKHRIALDLIVEDNIIVDADTAIVLGIVLTELIINAVKYAFPPPRTGNIYICAQRNGVEQVELTIADDGVGMKRDSRTSTGFDLVRGLVEKIKGRLEMNVDAGLRTKISFPVMASEQPVAAVVLKD